MPKKEIVPLLQFTKAGIAEVEKELVNAFDEVVSDAIWDVLRDRAVEAQLKKMIMPEVKKYIEKNKDELIKMKIERVINQL